jgi:hypothetical protein
MLEARNAAATRVTIGFFMGGLSGGVDGGDPHEPES